MNVVIGKYDRMEWDDGFVMLEMNQLEERRDDTMKREREENAMVKWMLTFVFEENLVFEIGRA